ncbi:MAG: hypothetical protein JSR82_08015 [Verrucomicrobia bacterium]|nr:hypothetical protein [Verrucomicrobiota bacterium]
MNLTERIDRSTAHLLVSHRWRGMGGAGQKHAMFAIVSKVVGEVFRLADPVTAEARVNLAALGIPQKDRPKIVQILLQVEYYLPFAGHRPAKGAGGWAKNPGVRTLLASSVYWEKSGMNDIVVTLTPVLLSLLPTLRNEFEADDLFNQLRLPGKYTRPLYNFLSKQDKWPVETTIENLKNILFPHGRIPPSLKITSNLWNMVLLSAVSMVQKFTDLRFSVEKIMGTVDGHHAVIGARFHLIDLAHPHTIHGETGRPRKKAGRGRGRPKKAVAA